MTKTVACIIARTTSVRLPLKVLRSLFEQYAVIDFIIERVKKVEMINDIYICTSYEPVDDILEDVARRNGVKIYRGDPTNIIERMLSVGEIENADNLIRITGDNPFVSFEYINDQIKALVNNKLDYIRLVDVPIGATAEVMTYDALKKCSRIMNQDYSEYLMLYMFDPENFKCGVIRPLDGDFSGQSITVDTKEDLKKAKDILDSKSGGLFIKYCRLFDGCQT